MFSGLLITPSKPHSSFNSLSSDFNKILTQLEEIEIESAKMLATMMYFLKGTPYIYQGQEIGMTNMQVKSLDDYVDIETKDVLDMMNKLPLTKKYIEKSIKYSPAENPQRNYVTAILCATEGRMVQAHELVDGLPDYLKINCQQIISSLAGGEGK